MQKCKNVEIRKYKVEIEKWKVEIEKWKVEKWKVKNRENTASKPQHLRNQKQIIFKTITNY